MISTSCNALAREVLSRAVAGRPPKLLPRALVEEPCNQALFGVLAEGLADLFEPRLCDVYARLFAQALEHAEPSLDAASLVARYERVRQPRPVAREPRQVFVLSRVTLGADVAVTSVLLSAAKSRFPRSAIVFVGPEKNFELFVGDPRLRHAPVEYVRGNLRDRLAAWKELRDLVSAKTALVIDPDSRLTQLGLLPVCAEERYHLFESRAYGGDSGRALSELAARWAADTFGVPGAEPYLALGPLPPEPPLIAVSLGVGDNPNKRLPGPFEADLLRMLAATGLALCVDKGAGGAEAARVIEAVASAGVKVRFWEGSFAGFAAIVAQSRLYVGYDSAGQHAAAASAVPLICIFAGFPSARMFDRWRPVGPHAAVIRVDRPDPNEVLAKVRVAIARWQAVV
ncbi:MAG: glycosyltransferase family 9 protein [Bryobacteraceae bacterium]